MNEELNNNENKQDKIERSDLGPLFLSSDDRKNNKVLYWVAITFFILFHSMLGIAMFIK